MEQPMSVARLAATTPPERDRLVDLVRAASIVVVVLGHWTMAALEPVGADGLAVRNVLEVTTWARPATWLLQVMPMFFLAAGFTNALALRRHWADGAAIVTGRVTRVLTPTVVFVAVWLGLAWVLQAAGLPDGLVDAAGSAAAMPLWFLAVYLLLALLAPLQYAAHRRSPWLLTVVLPPVAFALDRLQGTAWEGLALVNYVVVFGFCQELGFLHAEGRLAPLPRWAWAATGAGATGVLVLLTGPGPYPVSMIGLPGDEVSNMLPPSVCVAVVAVLQLCGLMVLRPGLTRWLERPGPWRATVAVNGVVMTVFLWHITGYVLAAGAAHLAGVPMPAVGSARWWAEKPLWLVAAAVVTAGLVAAFRWAEQPRPAPRRVLAPAALASALAGVAGLTMVACAGFSDPFTRGGVALAGVTFAPATGAVLVVVALGLARLAARAPGPQRRPVL
jgi:fucose 4-O-acetylase-like acetyltransferase